MCFIIVIMVIYIVAMMLMTMMTIVWNLTKILYKFSPLAATHFLVNQLGEFDVRSGQQLLRDVLVFL